MTPLAEVVVIALVAYRLWVLAARDYITERPREWVLDRTPPWVGVLVSCPWCLGTWLVGLVSVVATLAHWLTTPWWLVWPAAAALVGLLGSRSE